MSTGAGERVRNGVNSCRRHETSWYEAEMGEENMRWVNNRSSGLDDMDVMGDDRGIIRHKGHLFEW